ncbi:unnamed protein product [Rotaria socialis]|uniref:folate gamma-glutamyl hydrolase n=1 Tax=Rotaria socialis TaxID=392032 RepID=A0A818HIK0_9BILA|nr:unnamed protein product [Rotaria socialis]
MSDILTSYSSCVCGDRNESDNLAEFLAKLARFGIDQCTDFVHLIVNKQRSFQNLSTIDHQSKTYQDQQIDLNDLLSEIKILENEFYNILSILYPSDDKNKQVLFSKLQSYLSNFVEINLRFKSLENSTKEIHSNTANDVEQSINAGELLIKKSNQSLSTITCTSNKSSIVLSSSFFSNDDIDKNIDVGKNWKFANIIHTRFQISLIASSSQSIICYDNRNHFLNLLRTDGHYQQNLKWKYEPIVDLHWCSFMDRFIAVCHDSIYSIQDDRSKLFSKDAIIINKVLSLEKFHSAQIACNENKILLYTIFQQKSAIQIYDRQLIKEKTFHSSIYKQLPINSNSFCCTNTLIGLTHKDEILISYFPYITPKKVSLLLFDIDTFELSYSIDLNNCSTIYTMKCLKKYNIFFGLSDEKILWIIKINNDETIQLTKKTLYTDQTKIFKINPHHMMTIRLLLIILFITQINGKNQKTFSPIENSRPIIGILTQPAPSIWQASNRTTYLAASYVKYVESTGAQVVPIRMYQPIDYYLHLFNSLNGVLFPGGDFSNEYFYVAKLFYAWSLKEFDETSKLFPVWGTCLGFEVLLMLTRSSIDILEPCKGYDFATELTFMPDAADSQLLGSSLPLNIKNALQNDSTTANYHNFCMRPTNFSADPILSTFYKMLTISSDLEGKTFVSTIESRRYPVFGVQWHPEKNGFEWRVNTTIPHTSNAVKVMQYTANFLTNQTRQNMNHFESIEDETKHLIYQYTSEFTDLVESHFQQIYFFYE